MRLLLALTAAAGGCLQPARGVNSTEYWLGRRAALIDAVFGAGPGVLPTRSDPDRIDEEVAPGVSALVWNMSSRFEITSTVFHAPLPARLGKPKGAFLFHHGHSNCACPTKRGDPKIVAAKCRPGCNSTMPTGKQLDDPGYTWWDLYKVTDFLHTLGYDVFILSMPLKGVNLGPGCTHDALSSDHWWFLQWELQGDKPMRYFVEPSILTVNYATQRLGLKTVHMAGLSGGGWSTTIVPAMDPRIQASFPMAGSLPCEYRDPDRTTWPIGSDKEDYEQNCAPNPYDVVPMRPGRPLYQACNYTCQYLLSGLEPGRFQVQILHDRDECCYATWGRHRMALKYEAEVRAELAARPASGWFTVTATNHTKHEVSPKERRVLAAALAAAPAPGSGAWQALPCDIIHNKEPLPNARCPEPNPDLGADAEQTPSNRWWEDGRGERAPPADGGRPLSV